MAAFQAGHVAGFRFLGGVPRIVLYDNLKSAVLERVGDTKRFNPDLLALASHYRFEPRAAAPARGSDKGRVERAIRYVRDSFFAAREFTTLERLNADALNWSHEVAAQRKWPEDRQRVVQEVWEEERPLLRRLPDDDFPAHKRLDVTVGKTPYVRFDKNDYSVPHTHVRQSVTIVADAQRVRVMDGMQVLADHPRSFSKDDCIENPAHVADLITWKRKAREPSVMSKLIHAVPATKKWFETAALRGLNLGYQTRKLQELLLSYGADDLESAMRTFSSRPSVHLPLLQQRLDDHRRQRGLPSHVAPVELPSARLEHVVVRAHDLQSYAKLSQADEDGENEE
jgi:hypothetical protein